jgi:hypothetical protein
MATANGQGTPTMNNDQAPAVQRPGITERILVAAAIRYSDYPEPGSIEIPYWTAEGEITNFKRWRLAKTRANGQKYYQEEGSGVYVYYPPGFFRHGKNSKFGLAADSVVLVEGEFKALSLLELGIYALGLPSFIIYHRDENDHRRLLHDLQVTLAREKIKTIYFLGDADTATNFEFSRQAAFLASAAAPAQVFLPRIPLDHPKGIDDCKEALGAEFEAFFIKLIKDATPLPTKCDPVQIALLLLEREVEAIKALGGMDREKQFERIIKLCAAAQSFGQSQISARLLRLAGGILKLSTSDLKTAIKAQRAKRDAPGPEQNKQSVTGRHAPIPPPPQGDLVPIAVVDDEGNRFRRDVLKDKIAIELPISLDSIFARELGTNLKPYGFFERSGRCVVLDYDYKLENYRLTEADGYSFRTDLEAVCMPFYKQIVEDENTGRPKEKIVYRSISLTLSRTVLASKDFLEMLRPVMGFAALRVPVMRRDGAIELLPEGYHKKNAKKRDPDSQYARR